MQHESSNIVEVTYPVMEHFATIQGEGFHTGSPAYFVRLGGCDVGCHWCDVKESWPADAHGKMHTRDIQEVIASSGLTKVVITGGEPAMYDLSALTEGIKVLGASTHIETSGVYPLSGTWDWITFSPKKFKAPDASIYKRADELKVIIFHKSDFAFAEEHAALVSPECKLYLQPEWSKREQMIPAVVDYVRKHPRWNISLQTHKYMNIP